MLLLNGLGSRQEFGHKTNPFIKGNWYRRSCWKLNTSVLDNLCLFLIFDVLISWKKFVCNEVGLRRLGAIEEWLVLISWTSRTDASSDVSLVWIANLLFLVLDVVSMIVVVDVVF